MLARLVPDEPEVHGLLALLELTAARFPARVRADGEPVLLEDQDRRRWDRAAIRRGRAALARGRAGRAAASAPTGCRPPSPSATRSPRPSRRRTGSGSSCSTRPSARLAPSPVVELNRAVAVSMAQGPAAALPIVDALVAAGSSQARTCCPSVRGELLTRLGRTDEARPELELAVRLCGNERERGVLQRKLAALR